MKKKILSALAALGLVGASVLVVAGPAAATHPQVSGIGTCIEATGEWSVEWTVTSDPGYSATGVFTSASRLADHIVGQAVGGNGDAIDPKPTETVATNAPLSLTVGIQFSNHNPGNIVENTGSVTFTSDTCEKDQLPPSGSLVPEFASCISDGIAGEYSAVLTLGALTTATYTLDGVDQGAVTAGTYTQNQFGPGVIVVTLTGEDGTQLVLGPFDFTPLTDEECIPDNPGPREEQEPFSSADCTTSVVTHGIRFYSIAQVWDDGQKKYVDGERTYVKTEYGEPTPVTTEDCVPVHPGNVTAHDVCGVDNDTVLLPQSEVEFWLFTTTDNRVDGVGTVVVEGWPPTGYVPAPPGKGDTYTVVHNVATWTFTFTNEVCDGPGLANTGGPNPLGFVFVGGILAVAGSILLVWKVGRRQQRDAGVIGSNEE